MSHILGQYYLTFFISFYSLAQSHDPHSQSSQSQSSHSQDSPQLQFSHSQGSHSHPSTSSNLIALVGQLSIARTASLLSSATVSTFGTDSPSGPDLNTSSAIPIHAPQRIHLLSSTITFFMFFPPVNNYNLIFLLTQHLYLIMK